MEITYAPQYDIWDGFTTESLDSGNPNISFKYDSEDHTVKVLEVVVEGGDPEECTDSWVREEIGIYISESFCSHIFVTFAPELSIVRQGFKAKAIAI